MSFEKSYVVICEGPSEARYLVLLNRFLKKLPPMPNENPGEPSLGMNNPLRFNLPFLGDASNDKTSDYAGRCVGSGKCKNLLKAWRWVYKDNKRSSLMVWADWDLYARNDEECFTQYASKPASVPDFFFSFQNFEDFLAMHFDDVLFEEWQNKMSEERHWENPLHANEYLTKFKELFPEYEKGELQEEFVSVKSLNNMRRHAKDSMGIFPDGGIGFRSFAAFISGELHRFYPHIFE